MAAPVLSYVRAASEYLKTLDGMDCHTAASKTKSESIVFKISQLKAVSVGDATAISVLVRSAHFVKAHADSILSALTNKIGPAAHDGRRDLQRWTTCHNFGTRDVWAAMQMDPTCATEIFCGHMSKLGLLNASEPTSAWIAAIIACVMYGHGCSESASQEQLQMIYDNVKSQLKRNYKWEPIAYVVELPATAAGLLKEHPTMALQASPNMLFGLSWLPARG
jgi:hypothetical protein